MYYHGDFEEDHLPHNQEKTGTNTSVIRNIFPLIDTDLMTEQYLYFRLDALRVAN